MSLRKRKWIRERGSKGTNIKIKEGRKKRKEVKKGSRKGFLVKYENWNWKGNKSNGCCYYIKRNSLKTKEKESWGGY